MPLGGQSAWSPALAALTVPLSHQATELLDAILEGYPKSKKQFLVSTRAGPGPATAALGGWLCLQR